MRTDKWKIFDKKGSNLNLYIDSFLNLEFITDSQNARGAEAYALTDPSTFISDVIVTNTGWNYDPNTEVALNYSFGDFNRTLEPTEASINFIDVSIFSPDPANTKGIGSVVIDISTLFTYPSSLFTGAIFLEPVSTQLIETEHLSFLQETPSGGYTRPYDTSNGTLVFRFSSGDQEIKLFTLDEDTQNITWTDEIIYDASLKKANTPIMINIGFKAEDEGIFERKLRIYHRINNQDFQLGEIIVNAQSIGPDERFDTLAQDFGLPNPKNIPHLFKRADINEAMPDWELLNYKGKHIVLEHDQIMPYIGTYKALINAIKWLGYEDLKVKEWFKNVKENKKLSLYVPYEAEDRTKTILYFSPEERRNLKKLNQLSLVYCITRETGEIDEYGTPEVEECYEYNINEILIKLKALKDWLEKNIIGVNARISDITGEGVYFERFKSIIYSTQDKGHRAEYVQSLTPRTIDETSELIMGDASIRLTLLEIWNTKVKNQKNLRIRDYLQYYWDPSNGPFEPADASDLWWDPSTIGVGAPLRFPLFNIGDIQWVTSVEKTEAGAIQDPSMVSKPIFIYDNDIRFYDILDSSTIFEPSAYLAILLENADLHSTKTSNDIWTDNIEYSIYPNYYIDLGSSTYQSFLRKGFYSIESGKGIVYTSDSSFPYGTSIDDASTFTVMDSCIAVITDTSTELKTPLINGYVIESSTGTIWRTDDPVNLRPDSSAFLQYAFDDNYKVPLFTMGGFSFMDSSEIRRDFDLQERHYLDIKDGKIRMKQYIPEPSTFSLEPSTVYIKEENYFINFNYDTSQAEQKITLNIVYKSPKAPIYLYDPSSYYYQGPDSALILDNSVYVMGVNHIGPYEVEIFGWDGQNIVYRNYLPEDYEVWTRFPTIWSYIDTSCDIDEICPSAMLTESDISTLISNNLYPLFDRHVPLQGLTLETDINGNYYIKVPSISYFVDLPDRGSLARFYNMTERVTNRTGDIFTVDPDYQWFNLGDNVNIVKFDKGKYYFLDEASGNISTKSSNDLTIAGIPSDFDLDSSTELYLLNDTRREVYYINNISSSQVAMDISTGGSNNYYRENQLVGIIIDDACTGYSWGSSFRVIDVSLNPDPSSYVGIMHTFEGNFPEFVSSNLSRYTVTAKHAFSTFADYNIEIDRGQEINNNFHLYLDDTYYHQYYLDSTFVYVNVLFDQEKVLDQWYDPSTDAYLVTGPMYPHAKSITVDPSTLVILDAYYDPSTYMFGQKNIWTVYNHEDESILFRVFNENVPYVFNDSGTYDVQVEAYDRYGNLKLKRFDGLIIVRDEG